MSQLQTGKITEWDDKRGFGFLDGDGQRVFLHMREYVERHHLPRIGDRVSFVLGDDGTGRVCAKRVRSVSSVSRLKLHHWIHLALLMILPALAVMKLPFELWISGSYLLCLPGLSWFHYANDKKRAAAKAWRISEARLHLLDFLGGWPGGFLAQKHFRHKTAKRGFQFVFWFTVILHQIIALDYLGDWALWYALCDWVEPLVR